MIHTSNLALKGNWQKLKKFNSALFAGDGHSYLSLYSRLTPSCQHYISSLNPVNLFEIKKPKKELADFEFAMVRDGLFTLFNFFVENETPKDLKTKLLIHENFLSFVPTEWQGQVLAYSYYYKDLRPLKLNDSEERCLIVKGILNDSFSTKGKFSLQDQIHELKEKGLKYKSVFFMPASKHSIFSESTMDQQFTLEQILVESWDLLKGISTDVRIVSSEGVKREADYRNIDFLDLNPTGLMYMDDYTDIYLLSRGARPAFSGLKVNNATSTNFEITPYHGVTVTTPQFPPSQFEALLKKMTQNKIEITQIEGFEFLKDIFHHGPATLKKWHFHE